MASSTKLMPFLLWALVQIPSLRALTKYAPQPEFTVPVFLLITAIATYWLWHQWPRPWLQKIVSTPWPTLFMLSAFTTAAAFIYPRADALSKVGRGSDADNAIIDAAQAFWNGSHMYSVETYFNNPISPGPGWVLLASPLVLAGVYWLLTPFLLGLTAQVLRKTTGSWQVPNALMLILGSSLAWWELTVVGGDLPALSCALLILAALTHTIKTPTQLIVIALLMGVVATSRIVLFYLPVLYALILWSKNPRWAVTYALVAGATCLGLHSFFAMTSAGSYPPLHLLGKGGSIMPTKAKVAALFICGAAGIEILRQIFQHRVTSFSQHVYVLWLGIFTPLSLVALADLIFTRSGEFNIWEGANYLFPPLLCGVTLILLRLPKQIR
ncbi:MAG: hypothetical protein OXR68_07645 [Alphaproteobacteria bacterium]|nr:hypothetical protein [Alphaproteobacteria bacterium]MDD9920477.1 hypothetical protein [Alphaproteobacteria bacterium]